MSTQTDAHTALPARKAIPLPAGLRAHRCEVARWALAEGRPLNLDAVTVILAARAFEASIERTAFHLWTTKSIITFTWGSATQLCTSRGIELPPTTAESLYTYLAFLADNDRLAPGSSRRNMLLETLVDVSGLRNDGRRRASSVAG